MSAKYKSIIDGFLREAVEDYIGLWQVIKEAKDLNPDANDVELRSLALCLVRDLLLAGFEAGNPPYSPSGYQPWLDQDLDHVIARIEYEWNALGREPNIGDIVWFGLPNKQAT